MAKKSKNASKSKAKKTLITIITVIIVIALIAAIIYISVKGMWGEVIDYLKGISNQETVSGDVSGDTQSPSGDISNPDQDDTTLVPDGTLEVKVLDVGQGDCILITFPDGQIMVMDIGSEFRSTSPWNVIDGELKEKGITTIDYMFLSHTDYDHSREVAKLCDNYEIKSFYFPVADMDTSSTWEKAYNAAQSETYVEDGETKQAEFNENVGVFRIETASWRMKCYSFDETDYPTIKNSSSAEKKNSVSPICLLEYADRTIVLTGDANFDTEEYVLAKGYLNNIDADVLKVGHHGSASSTSDEFLNKIDCEYAIISCGADNGYGHPTPEALTRLAEYTDERPDDDFNGFAEVYRTDEDGTITVRVEENGAMQISSADSPEKDASLAGTIEEETVEPSGEVATVSYFRQEDYLVSLAA